MTLSELVEEVLESLSLNPGAQKITRGEVKRLLNLAQREISLRIGGPRVEVTVPQTGVISGSFRLPGRFHPESIVRVYLVEGLSGEGGWLPHSEVRILSPGEVMDFNAWSLNRANCQRPALKYDRADTGLVFTPLNISEARYHFILNPIPPDMVEDTDEPFAAMNYCEDPPIRTAGISPTGHRVLAHHVSYELLQRLGDERWQAFYARYRDMEKDMFARISPTTVYLPGFRVELSDGIR